MAKRTEKNIKLTIFIKDLFKIGTARQIAKAIGLSENVVYSFVHGKKVLADYEIDKLKLNKEKIYKSICEKEFEQIDMIEKEIQSKKRIIDFSIKDYEA